jgi:hypothetical protein
MHSNTVVVYRGFLATTFKVKKGKLCPGAGLEPDKVELT